MEKRICLGVQVSNSLYKELADFAAKRELTISAVVRLSLLEYFRGKKNAQ